MSYANDIHDAIVSQITGLTLTFNSVAVPVKKRKLPTVEETIDTLPLIAVCPLDRPTRIEPESFEGFFSVTYLFNVVVIAAGNRDLLASLDVYEGWLQRIFYLFASDRLDGVAAVWNSEVVPGVLLDHGKLNQNYDYSGVSLSFMTTEKMF